MVLMAAAVMALLVQQPASGGRSGDPLFGPPPRVTISASATAVPAGWRLQATVTPLPGIHVYAPGSQGYIGVSYAVALPAGWKATPPGFPEAEPYVFGELKEVVNVYQKPFVITQTITPSVPRAAKSTTLVGTLKYQACTDRVCYPPQEQTVNIVLPALPPRAKKPE